jgi:hypothetical protein
LRTPVAFVSYRRLSSQFQISLSSVTLVYLSQWICSCLFVVSEVDLVVGFGRVLHDPLAQLIGPVRHLVPGLIGKYRQVTPEMEVTEIILAKVSRLCQLSSHSRGFLSRLQIFKSIRPSLWISVSHKTPSYYTKMPLKVVFDKTAFL